MIKSTEDYFADWEGAVFGYGYGTGEPHIINALKIFFDAVPQNGTYDYRELEDALGVTICWLLINILCRADIIEYGGSPRFAWLTQKGKTLQNFVKSNTIEKLVDICCCKTSDYINCYPDACNCGENGYDKARKCPNPFWRN